MHTIAAPPTASSASRRCLHAIIACLLTASLGVAADGDGDIRAQAKTVAATGLSLMESNKLVDAAIAFAEAMALYEKAKDTDGQVEMQANIFWCKKKMNVDDLVAYRKRVEAGDVPGHASAGGGTAKPDAKQVESAKAALAKIEEVVNRKVTVDEAQSYFDKAQKFAKDNPDKTLLIAVRWYEVAERFDAHPLGKKAQGILLDVQKRLNDELDRKKADIDQAQRRMDEARQGYFGRKAAAPGAEPLPDATAQRKAVADIRQIYAADFKGTKPDDKRELAMKLFKAQEKSKNEPLMRWAMLTEAIRLGVEGEHYWVVLRANDALGGIFAGVDVNTEKKAALKRMVGKAGAPHVLKLLDDPADPAANAVVGKYFCAAGEWKDGLAMLAAGNDEAAKRVANMEIAGPKDATEILTVADAWFDAGKAAKTSMERVAFYTRARTWYEKVAKGKDAPQGIAKARMDRNLQEIDKVAPPPISDWSKITMNQWEALKGMTVVVEARKGRTDPGIMLDPSTPVRVVPCPEDKWTVGYSGSAYSGGNTSQTTDWRGTSKVWTVDRGFRFGELIVWVDKGKVRSKCMEPIKGQGRLYMAPNVTEADSWWDASR